MSDHQECQIEIDHLKTVIVKLTERLEQQQKDLRQLESIKAEFLTAVSHEMRTPLTIIRESISQLQDRYLGEVNERQENLLLLALNNVDRLTGSIAHFMEIARNTSADKPKGSL